MNQGSDRLLLSLLLAFTTCTLLSPLEVLAAGPTGEPLTRQAFEQMIEQYIRSHPEVIEQSLQSLENKRAAEEQERQRAALATHQQELLNDPASPISGNPAGDVTVVEFFDYRCPYCKRTFPGVCIDGRERRGCPDPRCAGHAWGDRAREQGRHRPGIPPEVIAAIRAEYRPGEHGYRALAHAHGLPVGTVAKVLRGDRRGDR